MPSSRGSSNPGIKPRSPTLQVDSLPAGEAQEYWSRQPIASPVDLPNLGIKPGSPALQVDSLPAELPGKPTISQSLLKFIKSVTLLNHPIFCHPVLLLPSIFPSIRVFSNGSALCIRCPKYWSFSIRPFNEYSGLIPFRIDWFDLFAVQGTLKHLFQDHNLKTSIFQQSRL